MRIISTLLIHALKRVRILILAIGILLGGFQILLTVVARSIQRSNAFEQLGSLLPPFFRELLGPSLTSFMSFAGIVCLGYFHLAVMGSLVAVAIALGTMPTSDVEIGFMDLILARPLPRHLIITRTFLVLVTCTLVLLCLMIFGTWAGLNLLAPRDVSWPSARLIGSLAINLGLLMLCWGGVALALGAASSRRSIAGGLAGLLALTTFLLDYVAKAWQPAQSLAWLSPFRYYNPFDLLMGNPIPTTNLLVLAGITLSALFAAYFLFSRRDISH